MIIMPMEIDNDHYSTEKNGNEFLRSFDDTTT